MEVEAAFKDILKGEGEAVIRCVDLFCGVGGLTHGLIRGGIDVKAGIDIDPMCRFPYEANNNATFVEKDIEDLSGNDLQPYFGNAPFRLLAGCAPCQSFSKYSRKGRKERTDEKWQLVSEFGRLVEEIKPEFVTMENVPQLLEHEVFDGFLNALNGYITWWTIADCAQYGVPQSRKRLVLLASRLGAVKLLPPTSLACKIQTVREAISQLPSISAGEVDTKDALHASAALSDLNLRRIRASKPGGTWRDWDPSLIAPCHRKESGQTYPSVYGRMEWDMPAPTMTTQCFGFGNGRFGHPDQDRAISLREAAILQTFPPGYQFLAPGERAHFSNLGRLIGNAVPVQIGDVIAKSFHEHVKALGRMSDRGEQSFST